MDTRLKPVSGIKALTLSAFVSVCAAGFALGLSLLLRHQESKVSHQVATPEAWVLNPIVPTPETVTEGRKIFLNSCAHCHGADATGDEGPDLHGVEASDRYIAAIITHGIKGEMPSFKKKLGAPEIRLVTAFVRSLGP